MTSFPKLVRRVSPALLVFTLVLGSASAQDANGATAESPVPDPVVVRLGDVSETLSDLQGRFEIAIRSLANSQGIPMSDALRQQLQAYLPQYLQQRASELVLLNEAKKRDYTPDQAHVDEVVKNVESNVPDGSTVDAVLKQAGFESQAQLETLVQESDLINQVVGDLRNTVEVTDEQLKLAYQADKASYTQPEQVCASHILLDTEDDAKAVVADLEGGADFAEEAKAKSTGPSAPQGGDLGCFERGRMVKEFEDAAFGAEVGKVTGPVQTQFGWHVILVSKHTQEGVQPFDEVKDQVRSSVVQKHVDEKIQALVKSSGVQTFPDRLPAPPAASSQPDAGGAQPDGSGAGGSSGDGSDGGN